MDAYELSKWTHASFGAVCLISGLVAISAPKAPGRHPVAGRVFAVALCLVVLAILPNVLRDTNIFMLGMGWLAAYTGLVGWRALLRHRGTLSADPGLADWLLSGATALFSVVLVGFGLTILGSTGNALGAVCVAFGALGLLLVRQAQLRWREAPDSDGWLAVHIGMMCGAFGAALTAFLAVQLSGKIGPYEWIVWVAPTVATTVYSQRQIKARGLVKP